jgi:putative ABC transport system substrate-binding protein
LGWLRTAVYSIISVLVLTAPMRAAVPEKPLEIGVLALGPRFEPVWQCGPKEYQSVSAARRPETLPFFVQGLRDELVKLKYVEDRPENAAKPGRHFALDVRMGTLRDMRAFAEDVARKRVDIIFAVSPAAVRVAQEETRDAPIPIVMAGVSDPVAEGFVRSLAQPGGYITGTSHQSVQGSAKRLELFAELMPGLRRLFAMHQPGYRASEASLEEIRPLAGQLNIDLIEWAVSNQEELRAALTRASWQAGDGIMILSDTLIIGNIDLVLETSLEQRVPVFGLQDFMADWGALATYGPSPYDVGAHDALYVDKISKGAKPGDLAIEPIDPTFVVNLKAAKCLGISPPLKVLRQADRIIR